MPFRRLPSDPSYPLSRVGLSFEPRLIFKKIRSPTILRGGYEGSFLRLTLKLTEVDGKAALGSAPDPRPVATQTRMRALGAFGMATVDSEHEAKGASLLAALRRVAMSATPPYVDDYHYDHHLYVDYDD